MREFRKNLTENMTANIIWQYVSKIEKPTYSGSDNVLIFNAPYKHYEMNKVTEMVLHLEGVKTRIDTKYFSRKSNFVTTIANDILALLHSMEENILFVLHGEGSNSKLIDNLKADSKKIAPNKNIDFVLLENLDGYIQSKFSVTPNWAKRSEFFN